MGTNLCCYGHPTWRGAGSDASVLPQVLQSLFTQLECEHCKQLDPYVL